MSQKSSLDRGMQWVGQMVKAQRRIGTPGKKFWREGAYQVDRRFEYLLTKGGKINDLQVSGRKISLVPNNPATQAADNQKMQVGIQILSLAKTYFPETFAAAIDERATIENMMNLAKDEVVVLRNSTETAGLLQTVLGAAQHAGMVLGEQ